MNKNLKTVKLFTAHFEATVNVQTREFSIYGDFRVKDVYKLPPKYDWTEGDMVLQGLIDELIAIEDEARTMIGNALEQSEEGTAWPSDASDS